ncbi:hypothetical protein CONPUDRAFT_83062, partial [Coniophora puteana RWD-64-598 SS2]
MAYPQVANAPFDDHDADVIFRTFDNVDFRVFKAVLSLASPVFKAMFTLPQPVSAEPPAEAPVVPISEMAEAFEPLLLICYPATPPVVEALRDVRVLLEVARKYDIACAVQFAANQLISPRFLETNPVGVYCIAACYGLESVARAAALQTLNIPSFGRPSAYVEEMELVPMSTYHRLLDYHYRCGQAAARVADVEYKEWVWELDGIFPSCHCAIYDEEGGTPIRLWGFFGKLGGVADNLKGKPLGITVIHSTGFRAATKQIIVSCEECMPEWSDNERRWQAVSQAFARRIEEEVTKIQLEFMAY